VLGLRRDAGGMLEGCWRDAGGMLAGCWRDAGGMLAGCWRGAAGCCRAQRPPKSDHLAPRPDVVSNNGRTSTRIQLVDLEWSRRVGFCELVDPDPAGLTPFRPVDLGPPGLTPFRPVDPGPPGLTPIQPGSPRPWKKSAVQTQRRHSAARARRSRSPARTGRRVMPLARTPSHPNARTAIRPMRTRAERIARAKQAVPAAPASTPRRRDIRTTPAERRRPRKAA
jgi:hypothetical protein